jgi:hypothetical protein
LTRWRAARHTWTVSYLEHLLVITKTLSEARGIPILGTMGKKMSKKEGISRILPRQNEQHFSCK